MNKPLRRVAIFCGLLVLALLVRTNWVQFVQGDDLKNDPHNRRVSIERYSTPRGNIVVAGGKAVTGSTVTDTGDFKYERTYKDGPMWAPVTGRASQAFGQTQLEKLYDGILTGTDDSLFFSRTVDMFTGEKQKGGDVVTTLNPAAQKAAYDGLTKNPGTKGAVAAINPQTGAILALASAPSYDPSDIAGMGSKDGKEWTKLLKSKDQPMLNRALRQTYPPGSTFKIVTASAGLENGLYDNVDEHTKSPVPFYLPDTDHQPLNNENNIPCENVSIREALRLSCNSVFGKMSADLGNDKMRAEAEKFGFNNAEIDTPVWPAESVYPKDNRPQNAMDGIGQASNRATPLQMAMVAAAVANNGKLMQPHMVDQLVAPNLNVIKQFSPKVMSTPLTPEHAAMLQDAMKTVVDKGTGTSAKIPNVEVGGKTGTAQNGENNSKTPYAWFISYAKQGSGSPVAVAVVIESSNTLRDDVAGGKLAAPIAKAVMEAVLDGKK